MPGIVGIVGSHANVARARTAVHALRHFQGYGSREFAVGTQIVLGQVWRNGDRSSSDWAIDLDGQVALMLNGSAFAADANGVRVRARAVLDRYLANGSVDPRDFDGAFVLALADMRAGSVTVFNDRLGTLPVYYTHTATSTAFAPEAKALFAAYGMQPELSKTGIVSFLNCGYCLGATTLFEGVHCLEPGSALQISIASGQCNVRRYWKTVYAPARSLRSRRAAEQALHDAIRRAHQITVSDSANGCDLLLSGGWDSRGVLAYLQSIGRLPRTAVAWGRSKDVPESDPYLAERLAQRFSVPFKFIAYDSDDVLQNARSWCYLSELANDNTGWFAEGGTLLTSGYATSADFALVGDEAWGWHGHPRTEHDVRNANLPASLAAEVASCLTHAAREECRARYEAEIDRVLMPCANDHPFDRRDFLYLHGRVARFIFALGYYKELVVEMRRPFLLARVLEVIAQVPRRFRVDKNLYISMFGRFFPELAALPQRRASSLPEWSRDIRVKPELRRFFLDLLDERRLDGVLGSLLDGAALDQLKRSFFNEVLNAKPRAAPSRSIGRKLPLRLRQRLRAAGWYPGSRASAAGYPARSRADVLRCIALLSLLQTTLKAATPAEANRAASR